MIFSEHSLDSYLPTFNTFIDDFIDQYFERVNCSMNLSFKSLNIFFSSSLSLFSYNLFTIESYGKYNFSLNMIIVDKILLILN